MSVEEKATQFAADIELMRAEIGKVIVGQHELVQNLLVSIFAGGHSLLEGMPGLGKTMLVRTISEALHLQFARIQFTPDLMPSDITGTNILAEDETGKRFFQFQPGPIFAGIILADEINRATPKTQSAMLEAMQEHSVTVSGVVRKLPEPFFVLATQNPIEQEGTYPLPEAQLDRFMMKLLVGFPSREEMSSILGRTTTSVDNHAQPIMNGEKMLEIKEFVREFPIAPHIQDFAVNMVMGTHPDDENASELVKQYVRYGSSPRGAQSLVLGGKVNALMNGRLHVSMDDILKIVKPVLRHRIILNFEGEAEGIKPDAIIDELTEKITNKNASEVIV